MGNIIDALAFAPPELQPEHRAALERHPHVREVRTSSGDALSLMVLHGASYRAGGGGEGKGTWDTPAAPTVLYCHGNAEDLRTAEPGLRALVESLGTTCGALVAFDYAGFGLSTGVPSEAQMYADAEVARRFVLDHGYGEGSRLVLMGRSIGSAAALHLAVRFPESAGLILVSPIASAAVDPTLATLAPELANRFDNVRKAAQLRPSMPVALIHGECDDVVPKENAVQLLRVMQQQTRRHQRTTAPITCSWLRGAGHVDIDREPHRHAYHRAVRSFLDGLKSHGLPIAPATM